MIFLMCMDAMEGTLPIATAGHCMEKGRPATLNLIHRVIWNEIGPQQIKC